MAYTNETTHFGFPLPLGTDLTVPMDYNESLEAADTALFEAQTNAAGAVGTAGNALTVANEAKTEAASATATANSATATANAAATAANQAVADVAEAKDDALDMICAVIEETATAQYKHEPTAGGENYYFRYNDILYKTTATINVGDTIVPNTNCEATNAATQLSQINNGLSGKQKAFTVNTFTGTTDTFGNINVPTTMVKPSTGVLIGASVANAFVVYDSNVTFDTFILRVRNNDENMTNVASQSVTVQVIYVVSD